MFDGVGIKTGVKIQHFLEVFQIKHLLLYIFILIVNPRAGEETLKAEPKLKRK